MFDILRDTDPNCECCTNITVRVPKEFLELVREQVQPHDVPIETVLALAVIHGYLAPTFWPSVAVIAALGE